MRGGGQEPRGLQPAGGSRSAAGSWLQSRVTCSWTGGSLGLKEDEEEEEEEEAGRLPPRRS